MGKRIAKVKPSSDIAGFQKKVWERNCFVKVVDKLGQETSLAPQVWGSLEAGLPNTTTDQEKESRAQAF